MAALLTLGHPGCVSEGCTVDRDRSPRRDFASDGVSESPGEDRSCDRWPQAMTAAPGGRLLTSGYYSEREPNGEFAGFIVARDAAGAPTRPSATAGSSSRTRVPPTSPT